MPQLDPTLVNNARTAYLALQIIGCHILLPLVVAAFITTTGHKPWVLINLCICWTVSSVLTCLLFYADALGITSPTPLCLTQSAVALSVNPTLAATVLCLTFKLWCDLSEASSVLHGKSWIAKQACAIPQTAVLAFPYLVFIGFAIPEIVITVTDPEGVTLRHFFYCSVRVGTYTHVEVMVNIVILAIAILFAAMSLSLIVMHWAYLRTAKAAHGHDLGFMVRVLAFIAGGLVAFGVALAALTASHTELITDLCIASSSVILGVIFGTSSNVRTFLWSLGASALACRRRRTQKSASTKGEESYPV